MIVKFFKSNRNPINQAFNYLLNDRVKNQTAEVIFGDAEFATLLAQQTENIAYFSGCLSFKETPDMISQADQYQIIQEFMSAIIPDEQIRNQTNWTWIRHTDKNRLELNFVLNAQFLQPIGNAKKYNFFCQHHMHTIDAFQDYIDAKFNCASWKEAPPNLQKTKFENSLTKTFSSEMLKLMIEKVILDNEQLKTRADLVVFLKEHGFHVSREVKGSISILLENEKKPIRITIDVHASLDELRQKFKQSYQSNSNNQKNINEMQLALLKQKLEQCKQRTKENDRKRYFKSNNSKESKPIKTNNKGNNRRHISHQSKYAERNVGANSRVYLSKSIRKNSETNEQLIENLRATTNRNQQQINDITRRTRDQRKYLEQYVAKFSVRDRDHSSNGNGNKEQRNNGHRINNHDYFNQQQLLYQQKQTILKEQKSIDSKVFQMSKKLQKIDKKITRCLRMTLGNEDMPPTANKPVDEMTPDEYIDYVLTLMAWLMKQAQKLLGNKNIYVQSIFAEYQILHSQLNELRKRKQTLADEMNQLHIIQQEFREQFRYKKQKIDSTSAVIEKTLSPLISRHNY